MAIHNKLGNKAEEDAANFLIANGYTILHRNWRCAYYEIDIIAEKNELLRIIEVKALRSVEVHYPEQHVTPEKFRNLRKATNGFLSMYPEYRNLQFEILAITYHEGKEAEFFLIEDVFM